MSNLFTNFKVGLPTGSIYAKTTTAIRRSFSNLNFDPVLTELKNAGLSTIEVHHDFPDPSIVLQNYPNSSYHLTKRARVGAAHNAIKYGFSRIIAHPDYITEIAPWKDLGHHLLVENMDHLDPKWRSATNLEILLKKLPEAGICLDLAHAMDKPFLLDDIIAVYGDRIREVHLGEINMRNGHHLATISKQAAKHCFTYLKKIKKDTPVIFELALGASWKQSLDTVEEFAKEYSCAAS